MRIAQPILLESRQLYRIIILLILASLFHSLVLYAEVYGDYEYEVKDDGTVKITQYTGSGGNIKIPGGINDNAVTEIGRLAFFRCTDLTSVTIPDSVTKIGVNAFRDCIRLRSVTIPESVTTFGSGAFRYCISLRQVLFTGNASFSFPENLFRECDGKFTIYHYEGAKGFSRRVREEYRLERVSSEKHLLSVVGGTGSGFYQGGKEIAITAEKSLEGKKFERWNGGAGALADVNASKRTITMPEEHITLVPQFIDTCDN